MLAGSCWERVCGTRRCEKRYSVSGPMVCRVTAVTMDVARAGCATRAHLCRPRGLFALRPQPSVESLCGRAADGLTSAELGYNQNVRLSILGECHAVLWAFHAVASAESARPES